MILRIILILRIALVEILICVSVVALLLVTALLIILVGVAVIALLLVTALLIILIRIAALLLIILVGIISLSDVRRLIGILRRIFVHLEFRLT